VIGQSGKEKYAVLLSRLVKEKKIGPAGRPGLATPPHAEKEKKNGG